VDRLVANSNQNLIIGSLVSFCRCDDVPVKRRATLTSVPYILPTCRPLSTFLVPFGGAQTPQNSIKKTIFWLFWTISHTRMDILISLGPYYQAKILGHTSRPLVGLSLLFKVHWGVPKCPKTA
jgi:hypothetical protein